jgi:16S rRNA (guanine966-N2)-methyltransferase
MRVIAGTFRSRKLKGPGTLTMRPTSDRLRETLFNVLGPAVEDSLFVDLYSGTGAVGIEAISRGARQAILVESNAKAATLIRENLAALSIFGAELIRADAVTALERLTGRRLVADFIYLDPPYDKPAELIRVLEYLDQSRLVAPSGIVIAEHHWRAAVPERFDRLERTRQLEQGEAVLSFYGLAAAA